MAQTKYGDFIESLRGVIRWPELKNNAAWSLHDYRTVAAPFSIKDYSEWYYGLDKCTYLRLKIAYGLKMLQTTPATLTVMGENKTSETKPLKS
jgi:hypothetical protein